MQACIDAKKGPVSSQSVGSLIDARRVVRAVPDTKRIYKYGGSYLRCRIMVGY